MELSLFSATALRASIYSATSSPKRESYIASFQAMPPQSCTRILLICPADGPAGGAASVMTFLPCKGAILLISMVCVMVMCPTCFLCSQILKL